jgi:hypothetical protein
MKKFSIATVTLVALTSLVLAQAKAADPKAGSAAGSAAKAGGSAAPAKPGSGSAAAAPAMPKPAPEIAATLKQMGARTNCTGVVMGGADGKTEMKFKGSETYKAAFDGWFIDLAMTGTAGEGKAAVKMKMEQWMTYDPKMSKWRMVGVMNDGGTMAGTADFANGKLEAQYDTWGGMSGAGKFKDHGDMTDAKAGMKFSGEMSMDGGKTWNKVYDMTCKK